jgi:hypothetical protein
MNRSIAWQPRWISGSRSGCGGIVAGLGVWLAAVVLGLAAPAAVARDIEQVEAVGAAPILRESTSNASRTPRDRAVRDGLQEAVRTSAASLAAMVDDHDLERLAAALGNDPYVFVSRFRVVEDRGVQPALFNSNSDVESEYRVIVEVHIDRDLIREKLLASGMLGTPSGTAPTHLTRIALEGLDDYRVYEAIRNALVEGVGARSATPVEAMPGSIVIAVDSGHSGFELLSALERAIPSHLELIAVQVDPQLLRLRVSVRAPMPVGPDGDSVTRPAAARDPIDTTGRNRY